ncbi:hypothetical protein XU18_3509 [Perkinsela sp. CCAP 1560/4]|nr:hypothetical protein XU18_3509 [Perkinsela sp. CCAP 1560/4]|eukprot:KNH05538.1 hypothetical protein XU18_3509 [Perkinsela sp. CCAP 1560/4]
MKQSGMFELNLLALRNMKRSSISADFLPSNLAFFISKTISSALTRRKATSSWWVGPVPRRGGSQEPSKLSSCFRFGADPIDGRRKVVGWTSTHPWGGSGNRR